MALTRLVTPKREHQNRGRWQQDEARSRASFIASTRLLAPFLVPHRFEGNARPEELRRSGFGYGIRLNGSYLSEIMGHIRGTTATYAWGGLAEGEPERDGTPAGGLARALYTDATRDGVTLRNFIEGEVLEWMLSSVGGFIVVDAPPAAGELTRADELAAGKRPYLRFVPWSAVEDMGQGPTGYRFVKFEEEVDNRTPDGDDMGVDIHHVLYQLEEDGSTTVARYDKDGQSVDVAGRPAPFTVLGTFKDCQGNTILPLVPVKHGTHPELKYLGTGLLYGLADIVIDLFNTVSEMREGYRDAAFGLLVHTGADGAEVQAQLQEGSRLVKLGDGDRAKLERLAAESAEVMAGLQLIDMAVKAWALSARRQAAEAMQSQTAQQGSGVALSAEFQLDLKPLLMSIVHELDAIETCALYIAAQMAGQTPEQADEISVSRGTEFRLEDEASRIARICKDYILSLPLTAEMKVQLAMSWLRAADVIDLTEPVEVATPGEKGTEPTTPRMTVGERIEQQLRELTEAQDTGAVNMASMPPGRSFPPLQLHQGGAPATPEPEPGAPGAP
ncbi:MAG TPA: hypothetical protein VFW98_08435 [Gemmatimonadaceae bacterium]|nr:hypothetical protein [Gemmatimonadaceae bacterium]